MRKLLTDTVKYLLENPKELFRDTYEKPQTRSKFYSDRIKDVKEAINYLTFLAERLPGSQLRKVFTKETLQPLVQTILQGESEVWSNLPYYRSEEPSRVKNPRIFDIAWMFIQQGENKAWNLLPNDLTSLVIKAENRGAFNKSRIIRTVGFFIKTENNERKKAKNK